MTFIHFQSPEKHEWGFRVPDVFMPLVGDVVMLPYAVPDQESNDFVEAIVKSREFWFSETEDEEPELFFNVELMEPIPVGCVTSSSEWPATEHSLRKEEFQRHLESIRKLGQAESS